MPPQVTSVSRKPLTISLEEIQVGKIEAAPIPEEPEVVEGAEDGTDAVAEGSDEPAAE